MSLILFALAVVCYCISQLQQHGKLRWMDNEYGFWGERSYERKYRQDWKFIPLENWYYRFFKIKRREAFPLSATLLVSFTDGYHLMQLLFKLFLCASIALYTPLLGWWDIGVYFGLFGLVFTVTYKLLS
jgi:hypothetical protein